jgi:hypothetical protein
MKTLQCLNYVITLLLIVLLYDHAPGQSVKSFTLIDAATRQDIGTLLNGQVVNLATLPTKNLNIRANTMPEKVGSVRFYYNDTKGYRLENGAPYMFAGDQDGVYASWTPKAGTHTIKAIPYKRSKTSGGSGKSLTVTFKVIDTSIVIPPKENIIVSGELKKWHKVTLTIDGPVASEKGNLNPFLNYRLYVTFTHSSGKSYKVPGYFAADGNAAQTGASWGNKWRVHFAPDETGKWNYAISFRQGNNIAVTDDVFAGKAVSADGKKGSFIISATDKKGKDLRAKGCLRYVGAAYLQFAETGEYFRKAGADAPENFLAYEDFDNTPNIGGRRKSWAPHLQDWNTGDPTWKGGKGKGIIGAVNYLSEQGMNTFSFLTMNIDGDDKNVYPYLDNKDFTRIDVSKVDQWEIVMEHAQKMGMYLHFKLEERENDRLLNGGNLGLERKLYCRELIARFSHHLALNWNIGEENTMTDKQRKDMAKYLYDHDPYKHNIVVHTYPGEQKEIYTPLLGTASDFTGVSIQTSSSSVYKETKKWVLASASAKKKWIVANDEQGPAILGVATDGDYKGKRGIAADNSDNIRMNALWGNFMAGGAGVEYYFGTTTGETDISCQDFRSRAKSWRYAKYALDFFHKYLPFTELTPLNNISTGWCIGKENEVYVVYLKKGGTSSNISISSGNYSVKWYNPRSGGDLKNGSITYFKAGKKMSIGKPPSDDRLDWVVLITKTNRTVNNSYQAEDYTAQKGTNTATRHKGFTGTGYIDYSGKGTWMEWNNVIGNSQKVTLLFYYANGSSQNREAKLTINGYSIGTLHMAPTGSWTNWKITGLTFTLKGGTNTIRVTATSKYGGPNLDKLEVSDESYNSIMSNTSGATSSNRPFVAEQEVTDNDKISVYPNPTTGPMTIKSGRGVSIIDIYNSNGTRVYHDKSRKIQQQINLSSYAAGIYYIQVRTGGKTVTNKVVLIK